MESLLYGQIIDTLKCLDFNQLFALKQTNKYFKTLIGRYEHLLARKEFHCIFIANCNKSLKMIDLKSGLFDFSITNQLEKKWKSAIDRKIPIYLNAIKTPPVEDETALALDNDENADEYNDVLLKLVLNGGYVISRIRLHQLKQLTLHNLIINHLETSKDCSKMVSNIKFFFNACPRINPSIRTKEIEKGDDYVVYELSNIYNPTLRYYLIIIEEDGKMEGVQIIRIN
uniref:F-box domain-containing protein n=1 Tax=Meloidogyne hapla TaxID=6305 RepID=A0A1I8BFL3_MELHA